MDGAIPISPRIANAKAFTSASLGVPSEGLAKFAIEGKPYFGVTDVLGGELTPIAGGMPLMQDGKIAGGIGVGGSMDVNQDVECCKAAVAALSA
jgi:glc operon protein GlcG